MNDLDNIIGTSQYLNDLKVELKALIQQEKQAAAEKAVREFAEKVKAKMKFYIDAGYPPVVEDIDQLLKAELGGKE